MMDEAHDTQTSFTVPEKNVFILKNLVLQNLCVRNNSKREIKSLQGL